MSAEPTTRVATAGAPPAGAPAPGGLTHRQITVIILGLMSGMLLAALDQTIVSTAIRTIGDDLHQLSAQAWVTTAYLITSTVTTPLYGKLSDLYGRRPMFLTAITLFVIGSAASAFSTSMYELAGFRAFQGIGAGGLFSMALAILADIVPPRERAKYQGYFLAVFGTSSVVGPVVGGAFAGAGSILGITGWRWVFLVNVPIGIIALFVVSKVLHIPHRRHDHRIDWWGAAALIIGLVPLLIVAEQGREWGWASGSVVTMLIVGVLGVVAFVWIEFRMGDEALIPMRLFRSGVFSIGLGVSVLIGVGMFGAIMCLPLYLQIVKGASPTKAGLLMLPMMVGIMISSVTSGQITMRTGRYKVFPVLGVALLIAAFLLLLTVTVDTPFWQLDIYFLMLGLGLGLNMQTLTIAVQNAVPARDIGVSTAAATFFRQTGGTLGVAIFLSLLFNSLPTKVGSAIATASQRPDFQQAVSTAARDQNDPAHQVATALVQASQGNAGAAAAIGGKINSDSAFLQHINPVIARPFQEGFVSSTHLVYLVGAGLMVLALLLAIAMREVPLRTMSAIQERHAEEAAASEEAAGGAGAVDAGDEAAGFALVGAGDGASSGDGAAGHGDRGVAGGNGVSRHNGDGDRDAAAPAAAGAGAHAAGGVVDEAVTDPQGGTEAADASFAQSNGQRRGTHRRSGHGQGDGGTDGSGEEALHRHDGVVTVDVDPADHADGGRHRG
ncbi:MAG TPA: MDR family MFS transporter [Nakamurella sp.]|nr:MDR family MFS transporter [Nakamurella sp.]